MAISEIVRVKSNEGQEFELKPEYIKKSLFLSQMIEDTSFNGEEAIEFDSLSTEVLDVITKWLLAHEGEEPKTEEDREIMKYNLAVSKIDTELFEPLVPRSRLAAVINASYYLEMPDLIDTLIKYVSVSVDGKDGLQLSQWLEIPMAEPGTQQPQAE